MRKGGDVRWRRDDVSTVADERRSSELLAAASRFYWYHCVELAPGVVTDGVYDMTEVLDQYGFPESMADLDVLDVGRASGFFAFEFERRGARVVATDIASLAEWDWVGGSAAGAEELRARGFDDAASADHISGAFRFAKAARGSRVEEKTINVYDLDPAAFDGRKFDLVFAGSIASHLRDPILAFERLRSVTAGTCIVAAPSFDIPAVREQAMLSLVGTADDDGRSWWVMNARGLSETLLCAGFTSVEIVSHFRLRHRHLDLAVDHLVAHARP
jgi:SAM-dependent methyltransferase